MARRGAVMMKFKPVPVTDEDLDAYEKGRLAGLEKLAKVAPVGAKGPKWVPPKLNDDGSLTGGTDERG